MSTIDLRHGDCLELMKSIPDQSIDFILVDPPYGTTQCKWDSVIPFTPMWEQVNRIIKDDGAIVMFGAQPYTSALIMSNIKMFKYSWVWEKNKSTGFLNAKKQPLRNSEDIVVFYKKQCRYNPQKSKGNKKVNYYTKNTSDGDTVGKTKVGIKGGGSTERYPTTVLKFKVVNQDGTSDGGNYHPTQKPIKLLEYLIKTYTLPGQIVLDFAMGSGSTGVACKNLDRNFIGIELDGKYFEIAKNRIENHKKDLT